MELTLEEVKLKLKHHLENRTYRDYFNNRELMLKYREEFFEVFPELAEINQNLSVYWFLLPTFGDKGWVMCHGVSVKDKTPDLPLDDFGEFL